jgi:hypothetical protein
LQKSKWSLTAFFGGKPYANVAEKNARGFEEHKIRFVGQLPDRITDLAYESIEALRSSLDQVLYLLPSLLRLNGLTSSIFPWETLPQTLRM